MERRGFTLIELLVNLPDNPDIPRLQRGAWGQLGYVPQ